MFLSFLLLCSLQFCLSSIVQQPAVREHSGARAVLCSQHNSFRMAQRLLKGWTLSASAPHSNKQRRTIANKTMLHWREKGTVLIPAGDFGILQIGVFFAWMFISHKSKQQPDR